jgi:hypothetical protein
VLLGVSCQAASTENRSTMTMGQVRIVYTKVDHIIRRGSSYNLDLPTSHGLNLKINARGHFRNFFDSVMTNKPLLRCYNSRRRRRASVDSSDRPWME